MSINMQEQQSKEGRKNPFKRTLNFRFRNIVLPGYVSEKIAIFGSYVAISLIFVLDVISDPANSFHLLYIFPLIFIALHSSRTSLVTSAVALAIVLQVCELVLLQGRAIVIPVNLFFLIAFSNIICVLIARHSRTHILEIKRLSTIDPLTQLCNRRGFDKAMEIEVMRQRRYGDYFSLVVLDLDGFKGLNDTLGHKAGDKALILLADILRKQIRKTDTIARLGGDEFVVLMPGTEASNCHTLCQLLCHTIRTQLTDAFPYGLSASMGFATSDNSTETSVDLLSIADAALYRAKALGKGCVVRGYAKNFTEKESGKNNSLHYESDLSRAKLYLHPWLSSTELLLRQWKTKPKLFKSWEKGIEDLVGSAKSYFSVDPMPAPFINIGEGILFRDLIHKALLNHPGRVGRLIDFGCGSSLPTISAILNTPENTRPAQVWAVDVSEEAIFASQQNVIAVGLEKIYRIDRADMFSVFRKNATGFSSNLIVANLPYVPVPDDGRSEFLTPVNGGADGLRYLRPLLQMPLKPGTRVAIVASSLSSPSYLADLLNKSFTIISCDSHIVPFGPYLKSELVYSYVKSMRQQEIVDCFKLSDEQDAFITFTLLLEKK